MFVVLFAWSSTGEARTWHVFTDGTGDAPTIQAAIDSGKSTVCLPGGKTFRIDDTVFLRGKMQRLIGWLAAIAEGRPEPTPFGREGAGPRAERPG